MQDNKIAYYFIMIVRLCAFFLILLIYNYHEYLTYILTLVKQIENSNFIDIIQAHTPAECGSREWCEETWKKDKSNYDDYPYPYPWFRQIWLKENLLMENWEPYEWELWLGWDHPKYEFPADVILVVSLATITYTGLFWTGYFIAKFVHQWFF